MIVATINHMSGALRLLVDSGADLNLHNEVRYKVTMDTTLHHVSSLTFHIRRVLPVSSSQQGVGGRS